MCMGGFHIGELAKQFGTSERAIRYYEELGFIRPERTEGGFRVYDEGAVERLKTVLTLKELGLSLAEISELLHLRRHGQAGREVTPGLVKRLEEKKVEFEGKVKKYKAEIRELDEVIAAIKKCLTCDKLTEEATCGSCIEGRTRRMPGLMKTLL